MVEDFFFFFCQIVKNSTAALRSDVWQVIFEVTFEVESKNNRFDAPQAT